MPKKHQAATKKQFTSELTAGQVVVRLGLEQRKILDTVKHGSGRAEDSATIRMMIDVYPKWKEVEWLSQFWEQNKEEFKKYGVGSLSQAFVDMLVEMRKRMQAERVKA